MESGCVVYSGPAIPALGILSGDNMDVVIGKIATAITQINSQAPAVQMTTDTIVSKALLRSNASVSASNIIKRDFAYSLKSTTAGATVLTWDLVPVIRALPSGYEAALVRVLVSGKSLSSSNVAGDSRSPSSSLTLPIDRYPITVDFSIRVSSPTGNIDMTTSVSLVNPANVGDYRTSLDAIDLNPQSGQLQLTDHLNLIESKINELDIKQKSTPNLTPEVEAQILEIDAIKDVISQPGALTVPYTKDGSALSSSIEGITTDVYAQIDSLASTIRSQQSELQNLRNQIDSLT